ncbi:MAG: DUF4956 domain-containing protein [Lachnospiraceae bacterium]|nr:DUF4956 domain-containing protein [Lachnospiraceae bacterium]
MNSLLAAISLTSDTAEVLDFTVQDVLLKIGIGVGLGILVSLSYLLSARSKASKNFAVMLIVLPALVSVVICMVGSNVARAFSIAGIFALVRFRSIPGDSKDIVTVFFGMATGLAVGLGFYAEASVFVLLIGVVMIAASFIPINVKKIDLSRRQVRITLPESLNFEHAFDDLFEKYTQGVELQQVKTSNMGTLFELTYEAKFKEDASLKEFMDEVRMRNGNLNVTISIIAEESVNTTVL